MQTDHDFPSIPIALSGSAQDRAEAGARVADLMEHPGWDDLRAGVAAYERILASGLMGLSGSPDAARYADLTGEMKGVAKIEPIARGIVSVGEEAKAQAREAEIKEAS